MVQKKRAQRPGAKPTTRKKTSQSQSSSISAKASVRSSGKSSARPGAKRGAGASTAKTSARSKGGKPAKSVGKDAKGAYARSGGRSSARPPRKISASDEGVKAERTRPSSEKSAIKKTGRSRAGGSSKSATPNPAGERLQKIMARAGIASRRNAEVLITEGRVFVNGTPVTELGARANVDTDKIEVDGNVITSKGPRVYILLYKPTSTISAVSDPEGRPVVVDLVKGVKHRIFPVGRLDYDAEGVLLLTNDGDLTNKLIHPRARIPKTYLVKVKGKPDQDDIRRLAEGVYLDDGRTLPARAKFVRATQENAWIELTVTEGRNHLVKRMCLKIGHPVAKIRRTDFAGIKIGSLKPGEFRVLTKAEVEELKDLKETTIKARARGGRPPIKGRGKKD